MVPVAYQT